MPLGRRTVRIGVYQDTGSPRITPRRSSSPSPCRRRNREGTMAWGLSCPEVGRSQRPTSWPTSAAGGGCQVAHITPKHCSAPRTKSASHRYLTADDRPRYPVMNPSRQRTDTTQAPLRFRGSPNLAGMEHPRRIPRVLSIAGSDSGGGAGIQADLKAFAACGVHGMTAITAITAQNTVGVSAVHSIPPEMIVAQIQAVSGDIGVDAVKIGMLGTAATVEAVARGLDELPQGTPVVLDPVMVAESGAELLDPTARAALITLLLPRTTVVTPNLPEARALVAVASNLREAGALPRTPNARGGAPWFLTRRTARRGVRWWRTRRTARRGLRWWRTRRTARRGVRWGGRAGQPGGERGREARAGPPGGERGGGARAGPPGGERGGGARAGPPGGERGGGRAPGRREGNAEGGTRRAARRGHAPNRQEGSAEGADAPARRQGSAEGGTRRTARRGVRWWRTRRTAGRGVRWWRSAIPGPPVRRPTS